jgi:[ribosomal protein S5]-alanine N-acetyltransferase
LALLEFFIAEGNFMTTLNLTGTQTIETARLVLRRFAVEDAEAMFSNWASDDAVTKFLSWDTHVDIGVTQRLLAHWVEAYADPCTYNWAIVLKETGQPVGSIGLLSFNAAHFKTEVGYCMGSRWWGRGIMTEALRAVIAFSFDTIGLNRVEAYHNVDNPASGMVMMKAGMQHEGRFRQWKFKKGMFCSYDYYGILKEEYKKN